MLTGTANLCCLTDKGTKEEKTAVRRFIEVLHKDDREIEKGE
jgi:hypothetical protein